LDDDAGEPGATEEPDDTEEAEEPFSDQLDRWLRSEGVKTVGGLGDVFAEKSFAVTVLLLMFLPALPLPTGGLTHVFEAITVLVALQMVVGRKELWLPNWAKRRELGATTTDKGLPFISRRIKWFERFSKRRFTWVFERHVGLRVIGLYIAGLAIAAALSPPFSGLDTIPSLGAVIIALAIILEDAVVLVIGMAVGAAGVAVSITLGAAAVRLFQNVF
jgi:hypothetical protein